MNRIFSRDHVKYEGVRPINIYMLRTLYFLMFVFVSFDAWSVIVAQRGEWDPVRGVAFCMFASYAAFSGLGLIHPLRMLPIVIFMIGYKVLWLFVVAYPLWQAGTLAGSPAEQMARIFIWIWVAIIAVPWRYVFHTYVLPPASGGRSTANRTMMSS